jgi:hypothetical protein
MIGNAVPVKLAEFVAMCIKEYTNDRKLGKTIVFSRPVVQQSLSF